MKNISLRVIIGILFSAIGLASLLITQQALTAAVWLSFGNGLILSDLRLTGVDEKGNVYQKPIPKARTITAILLIVFAVLLLFFQMFLDYSEATAA
ncbi:hypothetical protein [Pontibacter sp. H249]|uniref:hypothetical protein n=1 Tax=Pontibacter sp. H249 TaxID=3133420 RepID=UPI0030BA2FEE